MCYRGWWDADNTYLPPVTTQQTKLTNNNTFPLYLPTLCSSRTLSEKRLLSLSVVKLLSFVFSLDAVRFLLVSSCKQALYWTRPDLNHRAKRLKFQVGAALLGLNKMLLNVIAQLGEDETEKYAGHTHPPSSGRWGMCIMHGITLTAEAEWKTLTDTVQTGWRIMSKCVLLV